MSDKENVTTLVNKILETNDDGMFIIPELETIGSDLLDKLMDMGMSCDHGETIYENKEKKLYNDLIKVFTDYMRCEYIYN